MDLVSCTQSLEKGANFEIRRLILRTFMTKAKLKIWKTRMVTLRKNRKFKLNLRNPDEIPDQNLRERERLTVGNLLLV